jgi:DNA-binding transcriptional ArsR family regulator
MKTSGTNLEHARVHNRRVIIEAVRLHGELTRAELARLTALTPQTVSNIVAELEQMDLLTSHQPRRASGRGQPAVPVSLNPASAWSIGIHLDHQTLIVVLVDLTGEVHFRRLILVQKPQPGATFARLAEVLDEIRALPTLDWSRVLGMGVVMPGPFGVEGISSTGPTTLNGWEGVDVAAELGRLSGLPVTLENDATVAAIGERFHGVARQLNSLSISILAPVWAPVFLPMVMCIPAMPITPVRSGILWSRRTVALAIAGMRDALSAMFRCRRPMSFAASTPIARCRKICCRWTLRFSTSGSPASWRRCVRRSICWSASSMPRRWWWAA